MTGCGAGGPGLHASSCYGRETLPCPGCSVPVSQARIQCQPDDGPAAECMACSLACPDCPAEVRITEGSRSYRARVIHAATCPWLPRYRRYEVAGRIPCGTTVTHRGPYKRDPERRNAA